MNEFISNNVSKMIKDSGFYLLEFILNYNLQLDSDDLPHSWIVDFYLI